MVYIGMIFQFDSTQGSGLIMLSDGGKKEFTTNEWVDDVNNPTIGQKISYESNGYQAKIKVASKKDEIKAASGKETVDSKEETSTQSAHQEFTCAEDAISYFTDMGFKLVKDTDTNGSRILTLRMFADGDPIEVIINQHGSQITVEKTVNGKPVAIS